MTGFRQVIGLPFPAQGGHKGKAHRRLQGQVLKGRAFRDMIGSPFILNNDLFEMPAEGNQIHKGDEAYGKQDTRMRAQLQRGE